jgi:hypothetical protein
VGFWILERRPYIHKKVSEREGEQGYLKILLLGEDMVELQMKSGGHFLAVSGFPGFGKAESGDV